MLYSFGIAPSGSNAYLFEVATVICVDCNCVTFSICKRAHIHFIASKSVITKRMVT